MSVSFRPHYCVMSSLSTSCVPLDIRGQTLAGLLVGLAVKELGRVPCRPLNAKNVVAAISVIASDQHLKTRVCLVPSENGVQTKFLPTVPFVVVGQPPKAVQLLQINVPIARLTLSATPIQARPSASLVRRTHCQRPAQQLSQTASAQATSISNS